MICFQSVVYCCDRWLRFILNGSNPSAAVTSRCRPKRALSVSIVSIRRLCFVRSTSTLWPLTFLLPTYHNSACTEIFALNWAILPLALMRLMTGTTSGPCFRLFSGNRTLFISYSSPVLLLHPHRPLHPADASVSDRLSYVVALLRRSPSRRF